MPPQLPSSPCNLLFYPAIHNLSLICLLEPFAQLLLLPAAVCQDVPLACDSGPARASAALQFSNREQGRLSGVPAETIAHCHLQSHSSMLTNSLLSSNTSPLPEAKQWHSQWAERPGSLGPRPKPASQSPVWSHLHTGLMVTCSHHTYPHSQD